MLGPYNNENILIRDLISAQTLKSWSQQTAKPNHFVDIETRPPTLIFITSNFIT